MDNFALPSLARQGLARALREDFGSFLRRCFLTLNPATPFLPNWHIDLIGEYLGACRRREIRRLIINLPPRALKSVTVSVAWPAFLLGHNPAERIMAASYAAGLSIKHSLDCRSIVQSAWYGKAFPEMELSRDQNEKHKFTTTSFGHRIATSVGGSATGEGGNFLIVDDPQNPAQAMSDSMRQMTKDWFDHTFATRLDDKKNGVIVVVMQRLHADDLTAHLLNKGGWEQLTLPAVATRSCAYHFGGVHQQRREGELLHAAREDAGMIAAMKRELGSYAFAAQYQQEPLPQDAGMVRREWFRRYHKQPAAFPRIVQSWDTAVKSGEAHDASVCLTAGETEEGMYVLDVSVVKAEYPELKRLMLRMAEEWEPDAILIEDKASGQSLLQDLRRDNRFLPLIAIRPAQDKLTRFAAVTALIEAGKVHLPVEAAWLAGFESEVLAFPHARHDDQVDALSQYLGWVRGRHQGERLRIRRL